jgi:tail tube protein
MPIGVGGQGYMAIVPEVTMGTYLDPSTAGAIFVPIISESLEYTETKYVSSQIRQSVVASESEQSYYHAEGDITLEVDTGNFPMLLYASRHLITKTTGPPIKYEFVENPIGYATTGTGANPRTLSITMVRNGVGFGYPGCTCSSYEFSIEDGVLRCTIHVIGLGEQTPAALGTPTWSAAKLLGADTISIFTATGGATPTFGAASNDYSTYSMTFNHNAEAMNRIKPQRSATYVRYAETEVTGSLELDFLDKTEYNAFVAGTKKAVRLEAINDAVAFAASNDAIRIDVNNSYYETYPVALSGMGDLVVAGATVKGLQPAGGKAYKITVMSTQTIT